MDGGNPEECASSRTVRVQSQVMSCCHMSHCHYLTTVTVVPTQISKNTYSAQLQSYHLIPTWNIDCPQSLISTLKDIFIQSSLCAHCLFGPSKSIASAKSVICVTSCHFVTICDGHSYHRSFHSLCLLFASVVQAVSRSLGKPSRSLLLNSNMFGFCSRRQRFRRVICNLRNKRPRKSSRTSTSLV